ncbi:ferrochelatase [Roseomonas sp. 573]|uniref:Ferrochelatase n=2 Tax=Roseomonas haemaphysalidis TaxID=2768162 RepID=A0ABS3KVD1_9PROT|nr:ferrochelatase [Roseomonas haemaphysalidis]
MCRRIMQSPPARPTPARKTKVAVVLFNLGGPDSPEAVRPFLTNLFTDPAIFRLPTVLREPLGRLVAWRRTKAATENYAILGGRSPLLPLTEEQGSALQAALNEDEEAIEARCFVAMRYWHPLSDATARAVQDWDADEIVLLPLYPQFSTTTTGSSITAWAEACRKIRLERPTRTLCCWHSDDDMLKATALGLKRAYEQARAEVPEGTGLRILFSAHGLPETIVKQGDPYQWQVEQMMAGLVEAMGIEGLDFQLCYQSRVTPQKWLAPSTETALEKAAQDKVAVLVHPIAFVSEHSETLVELDVEYRELAHKLGVPGYHRAPTQNSDPAFIASLARLVQQVRGAGERRLCSFAGGRQCPKVHTGCPHTGVKPPRAAAKVPA